MEPLDPGALYVIEGSALLALQHVARRLYTETRMTGDEMRDAAQRIDGAIRQAFPLPDEKGAK